MQLFVWGIGGGTARIIDKWVRLSDIVGFIVSEKRQNVLSEYMGKPLFSPDEIAKKEYDAILVGSVYVENIYNECIKYGLALEKVLFLYRGGAAAKRNRNQTLLETILGAEKALLVQQSWRVIDTTAIEYYDDPSKYNYRRIGIFANDFVRIRTLELIAHEIYEQNIQGNVAELGVFRGEFTYFLNREFPDKTCYLFDTFEGFDENEFQKERDAGIVNVSVAESYSNTSIDIVKAKLEHYENVDIRKGYFPDSLNGLEDEFAFGSIDVDLEASIYSGLKYFYPRMRTGGYIMIHDYNNYLSGVKKAVRRYMSISDEPIRMVPIADSAGTIVIVK